MINYFNIRTKNPVINRVTLFVKLLQINNIMQYPAKTGNYNNNLYDWGKTS